MKDVVHPSHLTVLLSPDAKQVPIYSWIERIVPSRVVRLLFELSTFRRHSARYPVALNTRLRRLTFVSDIIRVRDPNIELLFTGVLQLRLIYSFTMIYVVVLIILILSYLMAEYLHVYERKARY